MNFYNAVNVFCVQPSKGLTTYPHKPLKQALNFKIKPIIYDNGRTGN
jgi:hypothetical protein